MEQNVGKQSNEICCFTVLLLTFVCSTGIIFKEWNFFTFIRLPEKQQ